MNFGSNTSKSHEIFRICWACSGEDVVKFSALYHEVWERYSSNKGQK
jgi:hypothetical protein